MVSGFNILQSSTSDSNRQPQIWAVLNLTPDSFYAGSRIGSDDFWRAAQADLDLGADVLDLGAESTRPYSEPVSPDEQWARLEVPLKILQDNLPTSDFVRRVSVDTTSVSVAERAIELGIRIINDVSAETDTDMLKTVAAAGGQYVTMHSGGSPQKMQVNPQYSDVVQEVFDKLKEKSDKAHEAGIKAENLICDVGIGFGKTVEHNLALLRNISVFKKLGYRLLAGVSRKSFIGKILNLEDPSERLNGSTVVHTYLALQGVDILRVHDVRQACEMRTLLRRLHHD